jgi:hypothetical protein
MVSCYFLYIDCPFIQSIVSFAYTWYTTAVSCSDTGPRHDASSKTSNPELYPWPSNVLALRVRKASR